MKNKIQKKKPKNIIYKILNVDPEEVLAKELTQKFGDRFTEYRSNYNKIIDDFSHNHFFDYPLTVNLELVNRCNLECVMCHQEYRNDAKTFFINEKMLDKLFADFEHNKLPALMLSISEPLLFKNIKLVLDRAKKANIMDIFLFTNGALLDEKKSEMILNSGITRVFISLDAMSQKTYNDVRVPVSKRLLTENRLDYVENNIKKLIELRNKQKKNLPLVRVSFVAIDKNLHEVEKFKEKWKNVVDTVEIQMERPTELFSQVKEQSEDEQFEQSVNKKLKNYNCTKPWADIAIYSDGTVAPCCAFVGRKAPIGNINKNTVKEIWNGEKMNVIREGLKKNNPIKVCQLCLENEKFNVKPQI